MGGCLAYTEYKKLGIEWLGNVPEHWEVQRLKFSVLLVNEKVDAEGNELSYMGLEHIQSWTGKRIEDSEANSEGIASRFIPKDILFGKLRPYLAKVYLAEHEGLVSTEALVLRCKSEIHPTFLRYYMISRDFIDIVNSSTFGAKMPRASWDFIGNLPLLVPSFSEQRSIAHFLDYKIAQIDALIAKKEALLEKLAEKRTALISQAVTKGLDRAVPLKDSGIEWLGEIPAHWIVSRAKFVSSIFVPQRNKPDLNAREGFPWLTMDDMTNERISTTSFKVTEEAAVEAGSRILRRGAVIASCIGNFGIAAINDVDVIINQQLQAFIPTAIQAEYLREIVSISSDYFQMIATAATIVYVNQMGFGNMPVLLPPFEEQEAIVEVCKKTKQYYDELADQIRQGLRALKEYRTALITNAVTGKIDVRDVKIPELESMEAA